MLSLQDFIDFFRWARLNLKSEVLASVSVKFEVHTFPRSLLSTKTLTVSWLDLLIINSTFASLHPQQLTRICCWKKSGKPIEVGSLSRYLKGFIHPKWCSISSINSLHPQQLTWIHWVRTLPHFQVLPTASSLSHHISNGQWAKWVPFFCPEKTYWLWEARGLSTPEKLAKACSTRKVANLTTMLSSAFPVWTNCLCNSEVVPASAGACRFIDKYDNTLDAMPSLQIAFSTGSPQTSRGRLRPESHQALAPKSGAYPWTSPWQWYHPESSPSFANLMSKP